VFAEQQLLDSKPTIQIVNDQTWLLCDGTDDGMLGPAALDFGNYDSGMTIYTRSLFTGASGDNFRCIYGHAGALSSNVTYFAKNVGDSLLFTNLPALSGYGNGTRSTANVTNGVDTTHCMTYTPNGTVTIHQNGTLVNTSGAVGSTMGSNRLSFFCVGIDETGAGGTLFWKGYVRHILVYSASHNAAQRAAVLAFLAT
jgi:hypothetical protein